MRAVIQRVIKASVTVDGKEISSVMQGIVVLLGVVKGDSSEDVNFLVNKITSLRIFEDEAGKMNLSVMDIKGEILIVSQFTLAADVRKGRRPGFDSAASPEDAKRLYEEFIIGVKEKGIKTETGIFQAEMLVSIHNDGPVTFVIDSLLKIS